MCGDQKKPDGGKWAQNILKKIDTDLKNETPAEEISGTQFPGHERRTCEHDAVKKPNAGDHIEDRSSGHGTAIKI